MDFAFFGYQISDFPGASHTRHRRTGLINPFSAIRFREMSSSISDMSVDAKSITDKTIAIIYCLTVYTSLCLIVRWTSYWRYGSSELVTWQFSSSPSYAVAPSLSVRTLCEHLLWYNTIWVTKTSIRFPNLLLFTAQAMEINFTRIRPCTIFVNMPAAPSPFLHISTAFCPVWRDGMCHKKVSLQNILLTKIYYGTLLIINQLTDT